MIQLLTGPTRSFKTTTLLHWSSKRSDCGGVLSPDVGCKDAINRVFTSQKMRQLYNVKEKYSIPWQVSDDAVGDIQKIGRFSFDSNAFRIAQRWLSDHLQDPTLQYIILDEIGPLELSGQGWDPWLRQNISRSIEKKWILVVRESIVEQVITHYGMKSFEFVTKNHFEL